LNITDLDQFKAIGCAPEAEYPAILRTFYSPEDDVHSVLKTIIAAATKSIRIAMFGYDDDELAGLVAEALRNPAMYVQVTLDKSQAGGVHERALLAKYAHEMTGNSVAIGTSEKHAIMHRKLVVVDAIWRISGSTNWSTSGETLQDNELTVVRDPIVCAEASRVLDIEHTSALKQMAKARK
jgi:phosphatidylserine/phosphatidylglycerophosphate/cardiolipin synthase-like enzyme